jgi:hypothetical protein
MTSYQQPHAAGPFHLGAFVIVTLSGPREKFWGVILDLSGQGLSLRGVDLAAFEDLIAMIRAGDPFTSGVVFFPMHRVERVELDLPEGDIHSLAERFREKTGQDARKVLSDEFLPATGKSRR